MTDSLPALFDDIVDSCAPKVFLVRNMSPLVVRRCSCRVAAGGQDAAVLWSAVSIQGLKEDSPDHAMALASLYRWR
jgi:hypothetical protein